MKSMPQIQEEPLFSTATEYDNTVFNYDQTGDQMEESRIIALGGIDMESLDSDIPGKVVMYFNASTKQWNSLAMLPYFVHHHGVTLVGDYLFVIGVTICIIV